MLIRKLKAGDRLYIGDGMFIDCLKAGEGALRLGISAPSGVPLTVTTQEERTLHPPCSDPPDFIGRS